MCRLSIRYLLRSVQHLLFRKSTWWVVSGLAVVLYLKTDQLPIPTSQLARRDEIPAHRICDFKISDPVILASSSPGQELGAQGLKVSGWFVLPESVESLGDNLIRSQGQGDKTEGDRFPHGHVFRTLTGDLEACVDGLSIYSFGGKMDETVKILVSRLRLCRDAIAIFLRSIAAHDKEPTLQNRSANVDSYFSRCVSHRHSRERIWDSKASNPDSSRPSRMIRSGGDEEGRDDFNIDKALPPDQQGQSNAVQFHRASRQENDSSRPGYQSWFGTCEQMICDVKNLRQICSQTENKLKEEHNHTCNLCYPRNEYLVQQHCAERDRREAQLFYVLCAVLITAVVSAAILVILHRLRNRNQKTGGDLVGGDSPRNERSSGLPQILPLKLANLHFRQSLGLLNPMQKPSRKKAAKDVEGHPELADDQAVVATHPPSQRPLHRVLLDRFQDTHDAGHDIALDTMKTPMVAVASDPLGQERIPVMPPARSSSVKLLSTESANVTQREPLGEPNTNSRVHQTRPFATIHTTNPTRRIPILRRCTRSYH